MTSPCVVPSLAVVARQTKTILRHLHPNSKVHAQCNRNPLALWVSDDNMQTWGYRRVLTDFPGHLAYPDGVVDEGEEFVHFAFDYNRHDVLYWGARLPACP